MSLFARFKSAARILIKGEPKKKNRNPIPAITLEEVAEVKQFFPREKFFIFSCGSPDCTRKFIAIIRDTSSHAGRC
jgi:hypothetical protein